jgi:hypothetical protein
MTDPTIIGADDEPIHGFFGLSYCTHLTLPRVLLQSMPTEWQRQFVNLIEKMDEAFRDVEQPSFYDVRPAIEKEADSLTEAERAVTGVTVDESEDGESEHYFDRNLNEIESWTRVLVPVADPLPSYNRGRTRVPRAGGATVTAEPQQWAIWSYVHGGWRTGNGHVIDVDRADRFTAREARALIDDEAIDGLVDGKPSSLMMLGPEVRTADDDVTVMNARLKWAFGNEMRKYGTDGKRADLTEEGTS